ncbi:hypothetical protein WR25_01325 [Diploscapter pachys]|uniref:Uncharacterized protein n=1 Tax=Diploscapter pachys TaxID=2018661 RepID=A0A2A2L5E3_9BILA|nr:hypothetical protein WR25_01325 [Diploscapter pachys]
MQSHPSFRSSDDETSRDSGFVDLEQEQAEMIMQTEFTTAQMDFSFSSINTSREMTLCEKLELDKLMLEDGKPSIQMQLRRSTRKPLSDLNLNRLADTFQWHLETVTCRADSTAFRRISADTLYGLLTSMTDQQFNSKANVLRSKDRLRNMHHYPRVDFMEMYVVNEGYRNFYHFINDKNITSVCEPHSYIAMVDRRFSEHLKKFDFHKSRSGCTSMKKSRTK